MGVWVDLPDVPSVVRVLHPDHRANIRQLGCMKVLAYPVSMTYR